MRSNLLDAVVFCMALAVISATAFAMVMAIDVAQPRNSTLIPVGTLTLLCLPTTVEDSCIIPGFECRGDLPPVVVPLFNNE